MGKYASRDSVGTPVAWGDITGKPSTFDPNPHDNAAHSTAYAPVAGATFTGSISILPAAGGVLTVGSSGGPGSRTHGDIIIQRTDNPDNAGIYWNTGASTEFYSGFIYNGGSSTAGIYSIGVGADISNSAIAIRSTKKVGFGFTNPLSQVAINGGLHVGGESDAGDNNLLVDGNATAGAFKTANFTILQSGTDLLIQYNGTTVFKLSSAGYLRVANEMEPHAAL